MKAFIGFHNFLDLQLKGASRDYYIENCKIQAQSFLVFSFPSFISGVTGASRLTRGRLLLAESCKAFGSQLWTYKSQSKQPAGRNLQKNNQRIKKRESAFSRRKVPQNCILNPFWKQKNEVKNEKNRRIFYCIFGPKSEKNSRIF